MSAKHPRDVNIMPRGDRDGINREKKSELRSADRYSRSENALDNGKPERFRSEARRNVTDTYICVIHRTLLYCVCKQIELDAASLKLLHSLVFVLISILK
jgi:hypothetical protein